MVSERIIGRTKVGFSPGIMSKLKGCPESMGIHAVPGQFKEDIMNYLNTWNESETASLGKTLFRYVLSINMPQM
jgi:hypothetical protein